MWDLQGTWRATSSINVLFDRSAADPPIGWDEFIDLIHPEDGARVSAAWRRTIESGEPYEQEYLIRWLTSKGQMIGFIETNLKEVLSPFLDNMQRLNLTARQVEIVNLIKEGKTTDEIAALLQVSKAAVDKHRFLIRKRLDLNKGTANLRSYLLSLKKVSSPSTVGPEKEGGPIRGRGKSAPLLRRIWSILQHSEGSVSP